MIRLHFGSDPNNSLTLGPAPTFLISANLLCVGPTWLIVAVYRDHLWEVRGHRFLSFHVTERGLMLKGSDRSPGGLNGRFGPFRTIIAADGALYTDERLFARYEQDTFSWYHYDTKLSLQYMIIESADSSSVPASA
jgi:hypothetical protein